MSLWSRIRNSLSEERLLRDLAAEMRLHLEEAAAAGRDTQEARRRFGNMPRLSEQSRDVKVLGWLAAVAADTRFGWRQLRKSWKASAAAVLSLALSIGACTGTFRLIDAVLLRPLPVAEPEQLSYLSYSYFDQAGIEQEGDSFSYPLYRQMRDSLQDDADLLAVSYASRIDITYGGDDAMEKAYRQLVSGNVFPSFGLRPALGRLLGPSDDVRPGGHPVAVLSYAYWTSRFGRDPKVLGRKFRIGEELYEIVGVASQDFRGTETGAITAIFIPTMMNAGAIGEPNWQWFRTWVRPRPGRDISRIRERLRSVYTASIRKRLRDNWNPLIPRERIERAPQSRLTMNSAATGASGMKKNYGPALVILGILVGLILLIACGNVANLLIAQGAGRAREMALRVAIGAGLGRLIQLMLVESALLSGGGTMLGSVFAWWSAPWVTSMANSAENPVSLVLPADWRVFGFAVLLTVSVTMLFGLVPALRASAVKPITALKGESRSSKARLMHSLVAAQVAFCFLVHFIAGLLVTTFERLSRQPPGFSADRVLLLETLVKGRKNQPAETWRQIAQDLRVMPGVESVAVSSSALMSGSVWTNTVRVPGHVPDSREPYFLSVGPGFLSTMRIGLLAGREFTPEDRQGSARRGSESSGVAIVSEAFARQYFDGQNPVGKFFYRQEEKNQVLRLEIVGYMRDLRYFTMREAIAPVVFVPASSDTSWSTFAVRTSAANPAALAPALRAEVSRTRAEFRVTNAFTQKELVDQWTRRERLLAALSLFFAVLALVLAGIGLYGVLNYSVLRRTREIGLRMALGAGALHLVRDVTRQALAMLLGGTLAGFGAGLGLGRYLSTLLFSVRATDLGMLGLPLISLLAAALLAALPPAIRAVRIDPAQALRTD